MFYYSLRALVERAFSSYMFIKNKYRNSMNLDLQPYLLSMDPDFKNVCKAKLLGSMVSD